MADANHSTAQNKNTPTPSKRAIAVAAYFNSAALFDETSEKIKTWLIEGREKYVHIEINVPEKPIDAPYVGYTADDHKLLKEFEAKLKSAFSVVNHVRFGGCSGMVVDTKPNTWFRRTFGGPRCSSGIG